MSKRAKAAFKVSGTTFVVSVILCYVFLGKANWYMTVGLAGGLFLGNYIYSPTLDGSNSDEWSSK